MSKRSVAAAWNYLINAEDDNSSHKRRKSNLSSSETGGENVFDENDIEDIKRRMISAEEMLYMNEGAKLIVCLVGKAARGKTVIAGKIKRYLSWLGYKTMHFEVSDYRNKIFGSSRLDDEEHVRKAQDATIRDMVRWLKSGGQVAIYDTKNNTKLQRQHTLDTIKLHAAHFTPKGQHSGSGTMGNVNVPESKDLLNGIFLEEYDVYNEDGTEGNDDGNGHGTGVEKATEMSYSVLWIESFCEKQEKVESVFLKGKFEKYTPKKDKQAALEDFRRFLKLTDHDYETLEGDEGTASAGSSAGSSGSSELSFIKLIDFGDTMVTHKVKGYIESKLASFCVNIHTEERMVLLVRHGESLYNLEDRLGGDPDLSQKGHEFSRELARFMSTLFPAVSTSTITTVNSTSTNPNAQNTPTDNNNTNNITTPATSKSAMASKTAPKKSTTNKKLSVGGFSTVSSEQKAKKSRLADTDTDHGSNNSGPLTSDDLVVYTSNLRRTLQTARHVSCSKLVAWFALSEIDAGVCEGMSYKEFKVKLFAEFSARQRDKLHWRYPQGESYIDVKKRLEPVIFESERSRKSILVVGHRAVLRCLYSYFADIEESETPFLPFPLHTVVLLRSCEYGWKEERVVLDPVLTTSKTEAIIQ